jgi:hypothetical protein
VGVDPFAETRVAWAWTIDSLVALREPAPPFPCNGELNPDELSSLTPDGWTGKEALSGFGRLCKSTHSWGARSATVLWAPGVPGGVGIVFSNDEMTCKDITPGPTPDTRCISPLGPLRFTHHEGQRKFELTSLEALAAHAGFSQAP